MGSGARSRIRSFLPVPLRYNQWTRFAITLLAATGWLSAAGTSATAQTSKLPPEEIAHMREELGVNNFTAPSIDRLIRQLNALQPVRYDKLWRPIPKDTPQNRPRMALVAGIAIADGFLAVAAEKQSRIEPAARALLRLSKGLGVGDRVMKRGQSVLELAAKEKWPDVRRELVQSQAEAEAALLTLKDEEIAHLVAVGGWIRGLEIVSTAVADRYSPERAQVLQQNELIDYFEDRLSTLNPTLAASPMIGVLRKNVSQISKLYKEKGEKPLSEEEVGTIRNLATEMVNAVNKDAGQ